MATVIPASKYDQMKKEVNDVIQIFLDDTKNSEQTVQLISEVAGAAIAVQGLGEVADSGDKAKVGALMIAEISVANLRAALVDETA